MGYICSNRDCKKEYKMNGFRKAINEEGETIDLCPACQKELIFLPLRGKEIISSFDKLFFFVGHKLISPMEVKYYGNCNLMELGYFPDNLLAQKYLNYIMSAK